ncbi:uncharacterized protein LOC119275587 [Triticum dicoccoides]|uniref:uncharacterized protein LOC119275587 n=1 Tax=Triticum dicoccoides TaxID=85692 RepID=UPI00188EC3DD|nr:uncharacterized protein LOC119275587 [Triticum dicoccoides]
MRGLRWGWRGSGRWQPDHVHDGRLWRVGGTAAELLHGLLWFQGERASTVNLRWRRHQHEPTGGGGGGGSELRELKRLDTIESQTKDGLSSCFKMVTAFRAGICAWSEYYSAMSATSGSKHMGPMMFTPSSALPYSSSGVPLRKLIEKSQRDGSEELASVNQAKVLMEVENEWFIQKFGCLSILQVSGRPSAQSRSPGSFIPFV